jgi:hypothetical protein
MKRGYHPKLRICQCCGYQWKTIGITVRCPRCKNSYWTKDRRSKPRVEAGSFTESLTEAIRQEKTRGKGEV